MPTKPIRDGFHAITPYLFAEGASQLIEFISAAFSGEMTFRKAGPDGAIMLRAGGVSVFPIMTLPSGERYGGVKDPCGNVWWVATHVEDVSPAEEERRWKAFKMP